MNVQPDPRAQKFGQRVRHLRDELRLSQAKVAERIKVDLKTIQRIEKGVMVPNLAIVWNLAAVFGVTTAQVLGEEPTPQKIEGLGDDLAETLSRLQAEVRQNTEEIREVVSRQLDASELLAQVEQISERLSALERRGRRAG